MSEDKKATEEAAQESAHEAPDDGGYSKTVQALQNAQYSRKLLTAASCIAAGVGVVFGVAALVPEIRQPLLRFIESYPYNSPRLPARIAVISLGLSATFLGLSGNKGEKVAKLKAVIDNWGKSGAEVAVAGPSPTTPDVSVSKEADHPTPRPAVI